MDISKIIMYIFTAISLGVTLWVMYIKYTDPNVKTEEDISKILNDHLGDIISIVETAMLVDKYDDSFDTDKEYRDNLNKRVIKQFRDILIKNNTLPKYIIDSLSEELFINLIDKAIFVIERNKKENNVYDSTDNIEELIESQNDDPIPIDNQVDISNELDKFYE